MSAAAASESFYFRAKPSVSGPSGGQQETISLNAPSPLALTGGEQLSILAVSDLSPGYICRPLASAVMPGLSVDPANCNVSGIPSVSGDTNFEIAVEAVSGPRIVGRSNVISAIVRPSLSVGTVPGAISAFVGGTLPSIGISAVSNGGHKQALTWSLTNAPEWLDIAETTQGSAALRLKSGHQITAAAQRMVGLRVVDDEGRRDDIQSFSVRAIEASAGLTLTSPASIRQGAAISGTLATSVPDATWSFVTTPNLTISGNGNSFSAVGPAQTAASTTYSISGTAVNGGITATTPAVSVTVRKAFALTSGPASNLTGKIGTALQATPALSYGGTNIATSPSLAIRRNNATQQIGTLCPGLVLNASNGAISGTPTAACSVSGLSILATDSDGATAQTSAFAIDITSGVVAGSVTFTPYNNPPYAIPEYNQLTVECWGPAGAGATVRDATQYFRSNEYLNYGNGNAPTVVVNNGRVLCQGNIGYSAAGASGGAGGQAAILSGAGISVAPGNTGLNGNSTRSGAGGISGGCTSCTAGAAITYNGAGLNGAGGAGGSGGRYNSLSAGGGGGGSYMKMVIKRTDANAPIPGSDFSKSIGTGGTNNLSNAWANGGLGGDGKVVVTVE
jgi:hypothetical protein